MTNSKTVSLIPDNIFVSASSGAYRPQLPFTVIVSLTCNIGIQPDFVTFAETECQSPTNVIIIFLSGKRGSGISVFVQRSDTGSLAIQRIPSERQGQFLSISVRLSRNRGWKHFPIYYAPENSDWR